MVMTSDGAGGSFLCDGGTVEAGISPLVVTKGFSCDDIGGSIR